MAKRIPAPRGAEPRRESDGFVMTMVCRIGHIGLAVRDLDRSVAFYTERLGMRMTEQFTYPVEEIGHGVAVVAGAFLRCDALHHCLSLFSLKETPRGKVEGHPYGLHHLAFEVATPERLLLLYRSFSSADVDPVARIGGPGNQPRFYVHDPDGNLLEFFWGIDQIGWDGVPRAYPPIQEIDLEAFDFEAFERERLGARA